MLQSVIFDLDGVIIDSEHIHNATFKAYATELGFLVSDEDHDGYVGCTLKQTYGSLKEKYDLKQEIDALVKGYEDRFMALLEDFKKEGPIPGVDILIKDLYKNGVPLGLASSSCERYIRAVLELFELDKFFRVVVSGSHVERSKPWPDIFLHAAQMLGTAPENCLVIEDSTNGVKAAKAAGMKCIAFRNPNSGTHDLSPADMIIDDFRGRDYACLCSIFTSKIL